MTSLIMGRYFEEHLSLFREKKQLSDNTRTQMLAHEIKGSINVFVISEINLGLKSVVPT